MMNSSVIGLVLSGGGARGAYQAGSLHALTEIAESERQGNPFQVISGLSAGALNAGYFAAGAHNPAQTGAELRRLWETITTNSIMRTDLYGTGRVAFKWMVDMTLSSLKRKGRVRALLDTSPLQSYLAKHIQFERIQANLEQKHFKALSITATDYASSQSVSFIQTHPGATGWQRKRRHSEMTAINADHIMASAAIPLLFPAVPIGERFFGDGCLRNTAPLSPAIRLGATKLVIVGVRKQTTLDDLQVKRTFRPSIIRTLGVILNNVLMDAIEVDIDFLGRINALVQSQQAVNPATPNFRPVNFLWITPSQDIAAMAYEEAHHLPKLLRFLMGGLGSLRDASEMLSYLLFEGPFCKRIAQLGYDDTMRRADEVRAFLSE